MATTVALEPADIAAVHRETRHRRTAGAVAIAGRTFFVRALAG